MRITKKVFWDLAIYMCVFGLIVGIIFPTFSTLIGVEREQVYTPVFIISSIVAGVSLGIINFALAYGIVGKRLNILSDKMKYVNNNVMNEEKTDDMEECLNDCLIPVDSEDVIGEAAKSFNNLIKSFLISTQNELSVRKFTEIFTKELDLSKLSEEALKHLLEFTQSNAGLIIIDTGGNLQVASSYLIRDPNSVLEIEVVQECFRTGKQIRFEFHQKISIGTGLLDFHPKSILVEPIKYKNETLGVILLASTKAFDESIITNLDVFKNGLSLGMHNAIIHDKLQKLAVLDPLTSVYNRRFGMNRLKEEFGRSIRSSNPFGLMMLDIDFFKNVNDTYGHQVGDNVLINVVNIVKNALRQGDILIRYGGEEFLTILPGANSQETLQIAEKIRRIIEENVIRYSNQEIKITISIGVSSFPEFDATKVEELIAHADEGLYIAKDSGRNKVVQK